MSTVCPRTHRLRGFALPGALIALVLISALVAGTLFVSIEESRAGRGDLAAQHALATAEWSLDRAIVEWDRQRNTRLLPGSTAVLSGAAPNDSSIVRATRLRSDGLWVTATARVGGERRSVAARRSVGASLELVGVIVPRAAALTALGALEVDGGVVDGTDAVVGDTTALCRELGPVAGVVVPAVGRVTCITCDTASGTGVFGQPPIDSSAAVDSVFPSFGDESFASLTRRATTMLGPGTLVPRVSVAGDVCTITDPLNWGDPAGASACSDWYPVVWVRGDAVLGPGARGQGVLLVDGSLRVESNAQFVGVVATTGDIEVAGVGASLVGAAFSANRLGAGTSAVRDGGAVRFSSCGIRRAALGTARLARTRGRWWVELR